MIMSISMCLQLGQFIASSPTLFPAEFVLEVREHHSLKMYNSTQYATVLTFLWRQDITVSSALSHHDD
jgi:hypothetical protein